LATRPGELDPYSARRVRIPTVGQDDYTARDLTPLTFRDAVLRRPGMYFGTHPRSDWPLMMLAWTTSDLMDRAAASQHSVEATVHRDGQFEVHGRELTIFCPRRAQTLEDAIRLSQWWATLNRSTAIVVRDVDRDALKAEPTDEHGHRTVTGANVSVRVTCDTDLLGSVPAAWWQGWIDRLPTLMKSIGLEPGVNKHIVAFDEVSGRRVTIGRHGTTSS
jgi:hypothetical protein